MNVRDKKGSITIFVLVGLLFMIGFLLISYGSNINKSKIAKEQLDIMSGVYSRGDGDAKAYERAYTALRKKNVQTLTASSEDLEDTSVLELTKTYEDKITNIRIYGNTNTVGNLIEDTSDSNYGKYQIQIKVTNEDGSTEKTTNIYLSTQLEKTSTYIDYIDYKNKTVVRQQTADESEEITGAISLDEDLYTYEDYTKIEVLTEEAPSKIEVEYTGYKFE